MTDEEINEATYLIRDMASHNRDGDFAHKMENYFDEWFEAVSFRMWSDGIREGLELAKNRELNDTP